jgi:NADPH-dependent 2,4-dienoyl-CoA reductase/sulfur reductase-like enzyme
VRSCAPATRTSTRAGDVANAFHPLLGRHVRVEHWANALNQPAVAAKAMLGQEAAYDLVPYFFTDQYDLGMEYAGYVGPTATARPSSAGIRTRASSSRSGWATRVRYWPA